MQKTFFTYPFIKRQSVIDWGKKYLNIDTGKYDSNKMLSIKGYTLGEIACEDRCSYLEIKNYYLNNQKWFTPRDDDWED